LIRYKSIFLIVIQNNNERRKGFNLISFTLNFSEFINEVKDKDKDVIIDLAESEAKEAEKISEMKKCGHEYVDAILGLIYFLNNSEKPYWIKESYFPLYGVVCKKLVDKKQLSSDILKMLDPKEKITRCIGII
jgi:hypothetical protein